MDVSILTSIKNLLGIPEENTAFDTQLILHINSVFPTLFQLGVGPEEGFEIEDETSEWAEFFGTDKLNNNVISFMANKVRLLFDPPQTSFVLEAIKEQIQELEFRLNVHNDPPVVEETVVIVE